MSFYPPAVQQRFDSPRNPNPGEPASSRGRSASFQCGSFVAFSLRVDAESNAVSGAAFQTNGCGYMVAAADVLVDLIKGRELVELHGLNDEELHAQICEIIEILPSGRHQCVDVCLEAIKQSFADLRTRRIAESPQDEPLVCTCFGVSEETIQMQIDDGAMTTVDEVAARCNAGSGCGSCRMLIQEMIDATSDEL